MTELVECNTQLHKTLQRLWSDALTQHKLQQHQLRKITYDDLPRVPTNTKDRFKQQVIPLSLESVGVLKPWETLDNDMIIYIWNTVYDNTELHIQEGDIACEHFLVARALVSDLDTA